MTERHHLPLAGSSRTATPRPTRECLDWWTQVMDALPFYALLIDSEHNIVAHNRAVVEHLGHSHIVGEYCPRVIHGLDHPYAGCPLEESVLDNCAVEREVHDAKTDTWTYSAVFPTSVTDHRGSPLYFHVARDITDDKHARLQLSQSLEHHKALEDLLRRLQDAKSPEGALEVLIGLTLELSWMNVTCGAAGFLREGDELRFVTSRRLGDAVARQCARVQLGSCLCGEAAATMLPVIRDCSHPTGTPAGCAHRHSPALGEAHNHATFPLVADGHTVGVVSFYIDPEESLAAHQQAFLEAAVKVTAAAVAQRQARAEADVARAAAESLERRLLERVIASQEDERRRVARELHDDLGQGLSALLLDVRALANAGAPLAPSSARLESSIRGIITRLYHLAWDLRPQVLDDFGLDSALRRYISHVTERSGLTIDYDFVCDPGVPERVDLQLEVAVYRLAQEALTNVVRHARASRASVLVFRRAGTVTLLVEDDGVGMGDPDTAKTEPDHGLGITGMRERAALLDGKLVIESAPGQGTSIRVQFPVDDDAVRRAGHAAVASAE